MAGQEAKEGIFSNCSLTFVPSNDLTPGVIAKVLYYLLSSAVLFFSLRLTNCFQYTETVIHHGGEVIDPKRNGHVNVDKATHIISNTIDFEEYNEATAKLKPVVTTSWIMNSLQRNKQAQLRPFSPDPRLIFANVSLTCGDIPMSDKEAIIGATLALGGTESKDLSRATTHICSLSLDHPKCQHAIEKKLKCKIVLPHWFDDCFKLGKRIDEGPYLLPDAEILSKKPEDALDVPPSQHLRGAVTARPDVPPESDTKGSKKRLTVFRNKKVMLSWDLAISSRFKAIVQDLIKEGEGEIVETVDNCDMFICQYRDGEQYIRAAQMGKDIGSLAWLFYLITRDQWCNPLQRLLHYPVPKEGIPGFKGFRITLSNYGGEARTFLENLAIAAGATFTKTMKSDNTHLITARDNSEKCDAARDWNINMVNHLWLEESYGKCEVQSITNPRYTTFPPRTNLGEIVGQTWLDEPKLRATYYPGGEEIMDSKAKRKRQVLDAAQKNAYPGGPALGMSLAHDGHVQLNVLRDDDETAFAEKSTNAVAVPTPSRAARSYATPARGRHVRTGKENDTPSDVSSVSRSAKAKAISKLHDNIAPDLELYEKEKRRKSSGPFGGKRAADQYEKEKAQAAAARSTSPAQENTDVEDEIERPSKKAKTSLPPVEKKFLLTGYQRWLGDARNKEDAERVSCSVAVITDDRGYVVLTAGSGNCATWAYRSFRITCQAIILPRLRLSEQPSSSKHYREALSLSTRNL